MGMAGLANLGGLGGSPASAHDGLIDRRGNDRKNKRKGPLRTNKKNISRYMFSSYQVRYCTVAETP